MSQVEGCGLSGGSEDEDECVSSPAGSAYDDAGDMMQNAMSDEVTKQLAAAGQLLIITSEKRSPRSESVLFERVAQELAKSNIEN